MLKLFYKHSFQTIKTPVYLTTNRCYGVSRSDNIAEWIKTLDEPDQKRIRFIQNEV